MVRGISLNIVLYLFLAGAGSGMFLVLLFLKRRLSLPQVKADALRSLRVTAQAASVALITLGCFFLYLDLGVPEKFFLVLSKPFESPISFGAWSLTVFLACNLASVLIAALAPRRFQQARIVLDVITGLCALAISLYTGFYLYFVSTVAVWHSVFIVLLFLASALSTGTACLSLLAFFSNHPSRESLLCRARTLDALFIVLELAFLACFLISRLMAGTTAQTAALTLLAGKSAPLFWSMVVGVGLLAPLALEPLARRERVCNLIASICVIAGGLALRYTIIML